MLKRILFTLFSTVIMSYCADAVDYNKLIKPLENNNMVVDSVVKKQQNYGNYESFYNSLATQSSLLDKNNTLKPYLQEQKNIYDSFEKNQKEFKSFTIFYFISEDTSPELIRSFSNEMKKLKEIDPNIDSLLLTRGLIGGTFDSMASYVQKLQTLGINGIEITFHPWAYEYFKLDRVPAYALSYCKKDFRFKTCEHKFLTKGEISLTNFFEIVSDEDMEYKKYFQKLIEAK